MNELLETTVERLLADHGRPAVSGDHDGAMDEGLWARFVELGLTSIGVDERDGGGGGTLADAAGVVRVAARHAAALPVAETLLVATVLGVRTAAPDGAWTVAVGDGALPRLERTEGRATLHGSVARVAWSRHVDRLAVVADDAGHQVVVTLPAGSWDVEVPGQNLAGEPRDTIVFAGPQVASDDVVGGTDLNQTASAVMAAARTVQIAGALEGVLAATVQFATEREQFGRPIGRFQAVQQMIAELVGESVAARTAADAVVARLEAGDAWPAAAVAKVRAGRAATVGARIAHQVHGAIGFTQEHALHLLTRRLWSWRDEGGSDARWAAEVGRSVLAGGGPQLWPSLTN